MHRIGAELYARADLAQLRRLLIDLDVIARFHETGSRRQAADSGASNQNLFDHENKKVIVGCPLLARRTLRFSPDKAAALSEAKAPDVRKTVENRSQPQRTLLLSP